MGLPCSAVLKIAFLKISEKEKLENPEWAGRCERYSRNFVRDIATLYEVRRKSVPSTIDTVTWETDGDPGLLRGVLELHHDERSLRLQRHVIRDVWDNRDNPSPISPEYESRYDDEDVESATAATNAVLQEMANEMNCLIGFETCNYDECLDWQYYYRPRAKVVKAEALGFAPRLLSETGDEPKTSFELGFEWQLKILADGIAKEEWLKELELEPEGVTMEPQIEADSDEMPF